MKYIMFIMMLLISIPVFAEGTDWDIAEIQVKNNIIGYVYYTEAQGTQSNKTEKYITGLRLVCDKIKTDDPLLVIFWNNMDGNGEQQVSVKFKNDTITSAWSQDGAVLYKSSKDFIQLLKVNKSVRFSWLDGNVQRTSVFNLRDFNSHLSDLNKLCGTEL